VRAFLHLSDLVGDEDLVLAVDRQAPLAALLIGDLGGGVMFRAYADVAAPVTA
jgi:hypothetical protein